MRSLDEKQFHAVMAFLVLGSLVLDEQVKRVLPVWDAPKVTIVTFALGLVWVGLFAAYRLRTLAQAITVLHERLDRLQRRADALEDDTRRRRSLPPV
ncbi:MAG: hypothetical protein IPK26_04390 [Planctomycetes bacterium]|nr:hypothetical protein [Planctomycetota bacterium]